MTHSVPAVKNGVRTPSMSTTLRDGEEEEADAAPGKIYKKLIININN